MQSQVVRLEDPDIFCCASKCRDESHVVCRGIPVLGSNMWTLAEVSSNADCSLVAVGYFS